MDFERRNPLTNKVVSKAKAMTVTDVQAIAETASASFADWAKTGPAERRNLLNKAALALEERAEQFVEAMMGEIGATEGWVRFNVMLAVGMVREAAAITTQITGEIIPSNTPGLLSLALKEPVGVILGIAPWNAPIILGVRAIALPLACGNTVILKASETCPKTHEIIVDAFMAAGFPNGVVNVVTNAPEDAGDIVGALIDHPAVKRINFTGSTTVGRIIAERAAKHIKPCLLELGGKAPLVILEDADIEEAVKAAAFGAFMNQGQICMSTERIIVVEEIADEFCKLFAIKVNTMTTGDPREGTSPLGAVVDMKTVNHVNSLIKDARNKGANVLAGGAAETVLMPATIIDGVTKEMDIYSDESFGPICAILRARDEAHAIELANDTQYGLSASVYTKDAMRGFNVARQIQSGICHVNGPTVQDEPQMPFGGVGSSGYGRFGGKAGIDSFTELRWITMASQPGHFPI